MDVSQLKRIPLFAEVPDERAAAVATFATSVEAPSGKVIVREGGFSNDFFAIENGTARVERGGETIAELGPGDIFGEQGLLDKQERSASVIATSDIKLIRIEHWELARMKRAMPEIVEELKRRAEERKSE